MAGFLSSILRFLFPSTFPRGVDLFSFAHLDFERSVLRFRLRPDSLGRRLGWLYVGFLFLFFVWDPLGLLFSLRPFVSAFIHFLVVDCWMVVAAFFLSLGRLLPATAQLFYFNPFPRPLTGWLFLFDSRALFLALPLAPLFGEFLRLWWSYPYDRIMAKKMWLPFDREIPMSLFWLDYYYVQGCLILGAEEMEDRDAPIPVHKEEWYYIRAYYPHYLFFTYSAFFALWLLTRLLFLPIFLALGCLSFVLRLFGVPALYRFAVVPSFRFLLRSVAPPINFFGGYLYPLVVPYVLLMGTCLWIWGTIFWAFCEDKVRENDLWEVFLVSDLNFAFERYVMRRWWKRKVFYYFRRRLFFRLRPGLLATGPLLWPLYLPLLFLFYHLSRALAFLFLGVPRYLWHTLLRPLLSYVLRRYVLPLVLPLRRYWLRAIAFPLRRRSMAAVSAAHQFRFRLHFLLFQYLLSPLFGRLYLPLLRRPAFAAAHRLRVAYVGLFAPPLASFRRFLLSSLRILRRRLLSFVDAYSEIHYFPVAYLVWYLEAAFFPIAILFMASPWGLWFASQFPYVYTYSDYGVTVGLFAVAYLSSHRFRDWLWWDLKEFQLLVLGLCLALKAALLYPLTWIGGVLGKFIWSALSLLGVQFLLPVARAYNLIGAAALSPVFLFPLSLPSAEWLSSFPLVFSHLFPSLSGFVLYPFRSLSSAVQISIGYAVPFLLSFYDLSYFHFSTSVLPVLLVPFPYLVAALHYLDRAGWLLLVWLWSSVHAAYLAILPYAPIALAEGPRCLVFFL